MIPVPEAQLSLKISANCVLVTRALLQSKVKAKCIALRASILPRITSILGYEGKVFMPSACNNKRLAEASKFMN